MHFIQFFVAIAFATFVVAAPVPPQDASSGVATLNAMAPITHPVQPLAIEPHAHRPTPDSHLEKRGGTARKGGGTKRCKGHSVWDEIRESLKGEDPRETRFARLAAGIGSMVERAKNGGKKPGC